MTTPTVRFANADDYDELAKMKLAWSPPDVSSSAAADEFAETLGRWMRKQAEQIVCVVAELEGILVGMAWLVIFERVPNPGQARRLSGDVQSVYVHAEFRGEGLGSLLMRAICDAADQRGVQKVSVYSSERALSLYERVGFRKSGLLLVRDNGS